MYPNDTQIFKQTSCWQKELEKQFLWTNLANSVSLLTAAFLEAAHAQLVRKMNVVILRKLA